MNSLPSKCATLSSMFTLSSGTPTQELSLEDANSDFVLLMIEVACVQESAITNAKVTTEGNIVRLMLTSINNCGMQVQNKISQQYKRNLRLNQKLSIIIQWITVLEEKIRGSKPENKIPLDVFLYLHKLHIDCHYSHHV